MIPINTFQDILDALEQNPELRDQLRRHLLTEELLQMPAQLLLLRADVEELKERMARLEESVARLEGRTARLEEGQVLLEGRTARLEEGQARLEREVARMGGQLSNLMGTDYEGIASRVSPRLVRKHMKLKNATLVASARQEWPESILDLASEAVESGVIEDDDAVDLELADAIVAGTDSQGNSVYVLIEISMTVQEEDVVKARQRAEILGSVTGTRPKPAVIGIRIDHEADAAAEADGVVYMQFDAGGKFTVE